MAQRAKISWKVLWIGLCKGFKRQSILIAVTYSASHSNPFEKDSNRSRCPKHMLKDLIARKCKWLGGQITKENAEV